MSDQAILKNGTILSLFDVSDERADELTYLMNLEMHELNKPTRSGEIEYSPSDIITRFISLGQTEKEKQLCAYIAGRTVSDEFN